MVTAGRSGVDDLAEHLPSAEEVSAKNWSTYEGKVLRMNPDGSIPEDNPVINGVKSHIYTYGHRNAQGIAVGPAGEIASSVQGDQSADAGNRRGGGGTEGGGCLRRSGLRREPDQHYPIFPFAIFRRRRLVASIAESGL